MTEYTYDANIVSDLHKDAYGHRPSAGWWARWASADDDARQAEWDHLCDALDAEIEREKRAHEEAAQLFEERIAETMAVGAPDRRTAIRWLVDQYIDSGMAAYGSDYLCWEFGLKFGSYKEEFDAALKAAR